MRRIRKQAGLLLAFVSALIFALVEPATSVANHSAPTRTERHIPVQRQEQVAAAIRSVEAALKKARNSDLRKELSAALTSLKNAQASISVKDYERALSGLRLARGALAQATQKADAAVGEEVETALDQTNLQLETIRNLPIAIRQIAPRIMADDDVFVGAVVAVLPEGRIDPNAFEGEDVAIFTGTVSDVVKVGPSGRVESKNLSDFLPFLTVPVLCAFLGGSPDKPALPSAPTQCTILPSLPDGTPSKIVESSPILGTDGVIRVDGTNIADISNPVLEYTDGRRVPIPDPNVGSSLEQIFFARGVPKGEFKFTATMPDGRKLESPNTTTNPTISIVGPQVVQRGTRGALQVTTDADCNVKLHGGDPQISIPNKAIRTEKGIPSSVAFSANETGSYTVAASIEDPGSCAISDDGGYYTTAPSSTAVTPNPAAGTTQVTTTTSILDGQRPPTCDLDVAIAYPGGFDIERVTSNRSGLVSWTTTVPGVFNQSQVHSFVIGGGAPGLAWTSVAPVLPNLLFGSACGGSIKKSDTGTTTTFDPVKWIDDFNAATKDVAEFEVTVFCDQPGSGGDKDAYEDGDVGHTFVQISGGGQSITGGFYPGQAYGLTDVIGNSTVDGKLVNDTGHTWDVKKTYKVKKEDVEKMKARWKQWKDKKYNLRTANCTDFVKDVCGAGGVKLPDGKSNWPSPMSGVSSSNPGAMGEALVNEGGTRNK